VACRAAARTILPIHGLISTARTWGQYPRRVAPFPGRWLPRISTNTHRIDAGNGNFQPDARETSIRLRPQTRPAAGLRAGIATSGPKAAARHYAAPRPLSGGSAEFALRGTTGAAVSLDYAPATGTATHC
jgi:hypothetical protein